jgi:hemolysin activation/secretion protein
LLSAAIPSLAHAQSAPPAALPPPPPPQENLIQRVAPAAPPTLAPPLTMPEQPRASGPGESAKVHVVAFRIGGNSALTDAAIAAVLQPLDGQTVTLAQIEDARLAVLHAYRAAGFQYVEVKAALAPVRGAPDAGVELRIGVTEGYVGEVKLDGDIGPAGSQAQRFLDPLTEVRPLTTAALERALLLVSDIPAWPPAACCGRWPATPGRCNWWCSSRASR